MKASSTCGRPHIQPALFNPTQSIPSRYLTMRLITLLTTAAAALVIAGDAEALAHAGPRHHGLARRAASEKLLRRAKFTQRQFHGPPVQIDEAVTSSTTLTTPPPANATTRRLLAESAVPADRHLSPGWGYAPDRCPVSVLTLTQTFNVTVSVTAEPTPFYDPALLTSWIVPSTSTTEPCPDDESENASWWPTPSPPFGDYPTLTSTSTAVASTVWFTLSTASASTSCVIDTAAIFPVATATLAVTLSIEPMPVTSTVCATSAPSGTPAPAHAHCGVHGAPVGDYFVGQFVENAPGVEVTLEGCWQFCGSVWGTTHSCQSYTYSLNDLGAPRCDLYGSPVAYALAAIDNRQPDRVWFDLQCGSPTQPQWEHLQLPALHAADNGSSTEADTDAENVSVEAVDSSSDNEPGLLKRGRKVRLDF
ncbi:hypothetical protein B0T19DRAFT_455267 [Cercophora scortea]|uniref:Uncharacterized protein n=1 Tax=Cercophora scortea TaxID=314031 RepID=A0AAE0MMC3_9PEZI|nr:hypothetical protein B0T19DRAFT_455267 [Cercophora scortea]